MSLKICCIQLNVQNDVASNLKKAENFIKESAENFRADIVVLPEMFSFMGPEEFRHTNCDEMGKGLFSKFSQWAREYKINLAAGSHTEKVGEGQKSKLFNTATVFDPSGKLIAQYRKIHLFHLLDAEGNFLYAEGNTFSAGSTPCSFTITVKGIEWKIRLGICYDLRFPEYFRSKENEASSDLILLPSAFTYETGKDHWLALLRSRAIENQSFFVGCNQTGYHTNNTKRNYGHSVIFNPWGAQLSCLGEEEGILFQEIDKEDIKRTRMKLPALTHRVLF